MVLLKSTDLTLLQSLWTSKFQCNSSTFDKFMQSSLGPLSSRCMQRGRSSLVIWICFLLLLLYSIFALWWISSTLKSVKLCVTYCRGKLLSMAMIVVSKDMVMVVMVGGEGGSGLWCDTSRLVCLPVGMIYTFVLHRYQNPEEQGLSYVKVWEIPQWSWQGLESVRQLCELLKLSESEIISRCKNIVVKSFDV